MRSMTLKQLSNILNPNLEVDSNTPVSGIGVDSRYLQPGNVFFALQGKNADGHAYLPEASQKGALAAVVQKSYSGPDYGLILIKVSNPLETMQFLAQVLLAGSKARIIAVTGSMGKTTTKDFITALLRTKYRVSASPGNCNSQIGLPLAIVNNFTGDEDFVVLEMGMDLPGQLANSVRMAPPEIALITCAALVHAVNFNSLDHIARTKAEIFSHPKTQLGILNYDIGNFNEICQIGTCRKLSFSVAFNHADFYLENFFDQIKIHTKGEKSQTLPPLLLPGIHNRHNFLAAAAVARCLNVSWDEIRLAMPALALPERRLQMIEKNGILFVNDSYNANELSIKSALSSLPLPKHQGRRIAAIGEMLELGKFSSACHLAVGEFALKCADAVFCLGEGCAPIYACWQKEKRPAALFMERKELSAALKAYLKPGDVVLIKGARVLEMWKILDDLW